MEPTVGDCVQIMGSSCHRTTGKHKCGYDKWAMTEKKHNLKRKLLHAGGWQIAKRAAKTLPFGGTAVAILLVGTDIKNKGVLRGIINSGIDAIPFVGLAKNAVELVRGDFIPDKKKKD